MTPRGLAGWAILGCAAVALGNFAAFPASSAKPFFAKPLLLAAHRGGASLWPENTIEAYKSAVAQWPDILLEGDVQLTADGAVVLLHDDAVDDTTDGAGRVADMTLAQVKALDAGYRFTPDKDQTFPYRGKGITIPLFSEALAAVPDSRFLIELKPQSGIAEATVKVLQESRALDRVILASFNPALMYKARKMEPNLLSCYDLIDGTDMLIQLRNGHWDAYQPVADMLAVDTRLLAGFQVKPEELRAIRDKGIAVLVHTINDPETMRLYLDLGINSILTDRPNVLADVIAQRFSQERR